jgi:hypothetical protein
VKYLLLIALFPLSVRASLDELKCHGLIRKNRAISLNISRPPGPLFFLRAETTIFNPLKPDTYKSSTELVELRRLGQHQVQYISVEGPFILDVDLYPDFEPRKYTWPYMAKFGSTTLSCNFPKGN